MDERARDQAPADAERESVELRRRARGMGNSPSGGGGEARQQRARGTTTDRDQDAAPLTAGSVFSGVGLLDLGLHLAGIEHLWMCESDPYRRDLLRARFGVPVYDDVRTLRDQAPADADNEGWERRERREKRDEHPQKQELPSGGNLERRGVPVGGLCASVDLVAGGFPCKGASSAGKRAGFEHPETALWFEMRRVIREVRPRYVLIENVGDILGMAAAAGEPSGSLWGAVLGDLASLGFDVRWDCVPAAAVGAPHLRDRVFAVATRNTDSARLEGPGLRRATTTDRPRQAAPDSASERAAHTRGNDRGGAGPRREPAVGRGVAVDWGEYEPAIRRWEAIHGPAPKPLIRRVDDGNPTVRRVRARVDRSRLSALGDGVHVYCGWLVGDYLMRLAADA